MKVSIVLPYLVVEDIIEAPPAEGEAREDLALRLGRQVFEAIMSDELVTPSFICLDEKCGAEISSVGDLQTCPQCFGRELRYVGPDRIGHELPVPRMVKLPDATRSDMQQNVYARAALAGQTVDEYRAAQRKRQAKNKSKQKQMFVMCPAGHKLTFKKVLQDYFVYYCKSTKEYKSFKEPIHVIGGSLNVVVPVK